MSFVGSLVAVNSLHSSQLVVLNGPRQHSSEFLSLGGGIDLVDVLCQDLRNKRDVSPQCIHVHTLPLQSHAAISSD